MLAGGFPFAAKPSLAAGCSLRGRWRGGSIYISGTKRR